MIIDSTMTLVRVFFPGSAFAGSCNGYRKEDLPMEQEPGLLVGPKNNVLASMRGGEGKLGEKILKVGEKRLETSLQDGLGETRLIVSASDSSQPGNRPLEDPQKAKRN